MSESVVDYAPRVQVLFCDDLRYELFGKHSAVGIYGSVMGLQAERVAMPKFCTVFFVDLPTALVDHELRLALLDRGQVLFEAGTRFAIRENQPPEMVARLNAVFPLEAANFEATAGMVLQGRASVKGVFEHMSDPLRVVFPQPTNPVSDASGSAPR